MSYPTEKGIMYFAILEELGLIGFIIFMALLFSIVLRSLNRNIYGALLVLAVLASNITEATFVSFGGGGLLFLYIFCSGSKFYQAKMKIFMVTPSVEPCIWPNIFNDQSCQELS